MRPRYLDRVTACALTVVAVFLHIYYAFHAGGLWRDEANTVALATMPSLSNLWTHLQYDSFPILWLLVVRAVSAMGLTGDIGFRVLGCLVGLSLIAVIWLNARLLGFSVPLISLALLEFSPTIMRWGDSIRAYGFGICLILLTLGLFWKIVTAPTTATVTAAAIAAICSVQALYYNAVLLLAIGVAAVVIALRNRHWDRALVVLGICGLAAVSLLPYLGTIQKAKEWNVIFSMPKYDLLLFWSKLSEALSAAGQGVAWLWVGLVTAAVVTGVVIQFRPSASAEVDRRQPALYCVMTLVISVPAYFLFLKILRYPTQPWYYVALIGFVAMSIDGCLSALPARWYLKDSRWLLALCTAFYGLGSIWNSVHVRQTNVDIAARKLNVSAEKGDTIMVNPWYFGVSFYRYYHGIVPWNTVPPIGFHAFHRYDLLKEQMTISDPMEPSLKAIGNALKTGHRVWIVGGLPAVEQIVPRLAPAPYDPVGWNEASYTTVWAMQVRDFIRTHALRAERLPPLTKQPVNSYENASVIAASGWRPWQQ